MPTLADLPDLPLRDAVEAARGLAATEALAWEALDRVLRGRVIAWLQEREGEPEGLAEALFEAGRDAGGVWKERWFYLIDLLRDGAEHPAPAVAFAMLSADQWAGRLLRLIAAGARSRMQLKDEVRAVFGEDLRENHLTNLLKRLEDAGLIRRSRLGRETEILLLPAGRRIAGLLAPIQSAANTVPRAPKRSLWKLPPAPAIA